MIPETCTCILCDTNKPEIAIAVRQIDEKLIWPQTILAVGLSKYTKIIRRFAFHLCN